MGNSESSCDGPWAVDDRSPGDIFEEARGDILDERPLVVNNTSEPVKTDDGRTLPPEGNK
jgi:hypothetical protein